MFFFQHGCLSVWRQMSHWFLSAVRLPGSASVWPPWRCPSIWARQCSRKFGGRWVSFPQRLATLVNLLKPTFGTFSHFTCFRYPSRIFGWNVPKLVAVGVVGGFGACAIPYFYVHHSGNAIVVHDQRFVSLWFLFGFVLNVFGFSGKSDKAEKALQWLRGKDADVKDEFSEVERNALRNQKGDSSLRSLFSKSSFKPVAITMGLMFFQQFSGVNAVIFYTVKIFEVRFNIEPVKNKMTEVVQETKERLWAQGAS